MSGTTEGSTVVANNASADESLSVSNQTERVLMTSDGTTEGSSVVVNSTTTNVSNRSGRLLNIVQDPVENSIDVVTPSTTTSTTPDYYIFAVLNNNTILRKKPPTVPNKNVPFLIVGLLPNNTIVRKYPNGTIVPMERIIRVRGFDTRENPPPLPEITSNQVTNDPGGSENRKAKTVDQNTIPTIEANPLSLDSVSTSTTPETIIASSRTSPSTIRTESRFGSSSTDAQGTTTSSTSTTTGTTPSTTTSTTTSTTPGTTSTSSGTTLGPVGAISSETSTSDVKSSSIDSGSVSSDASTTPVEMMTLESSTIGTSTFGGATNPTPETLSQLLLNGRTLEAFNDIVNSAQTSTTDTDTNYQTPQGIQYTGVLNIQDLLKNNNQNSVFRGKPVTRPTNFDKIDLTTVEPPSSTTANFPTEKSTMSTATTSAPTTSKAEPTTIQQDSITLSNAIVEDQPSTTTTIAPTTANQQLTTAEVPTTTTTQLPTTTTTGLQPRYTSTPTTTVLSTPRPTTLSTLPTATIFPTFLTTLFPNLFLPEVPTTRLPKPRGTRAPEVVRISAAPSVTETIGFAASSTRATTVAPPTTRITTRATTTTTAPTTTTTIPTTTTPRITTTTTETTTRQTTTTTVAPTVTTNAVEVTTVKKLKQLTEEQKENLRTLRKLEEEQSALLKQLSFLTSLNLGGAPKRTGKASKPVKPPNDNLAERVIELALARDKTKTTTSKPPTSIQDQLAAIDASKEPKKSTPSIEDVLKQYNLGGLDIATTPKASVYGNSEDAILASILKEQGFAPPTPKSLGDQIKQAGVFESTSKRPKPKPRTTTTPAPTPREAETVKPKKPPVDEELLANSPTHITPVVTSSPPKSQQKSPPKQVANALTQDDIQKLIKQLEGLQKDPSKGVLDFANGEHGATSRMTTTIRSTTQRRQERKLSTRAPQLTVSNSIEDLEVPTTSKPMRAPVGFRPVPGVDDDSSESLVRSNLITAAVNVTKAISGFLGTALQGAAQSFQSLLGSGSSLGTRVLGSAASGSSAGPG
ncbi:hypothetical protein JTB14_016008 [Gonioctena quinquepunctata]|nr:hypothetical protein JTB14_016008 [Gonioctena quinquepunctata]